MPCRLPACKLTCIWPVALQADGAVLFNDCHEVRSARQVLQRWVNSAGGSSGSGTEDTIMAVFPGGHSGSSGSGHSSGGGGSTQADEGLQPFSALRTWQPLSGTVRATLHMLAATAQSSHSTLPAMLHSLQQSAPAGGSGEALASAAHQMLQGLLSQQQVQQLRQAVGATSDSDALKRLCEFVGALLEAAGQVGALPRCMLVVLGMRPTAVWIIKAAG